MNKTEMNKLVKTAETQFRALSKTLGQLGRKEGIAISCEMEGSTYFEEGDYISIVYRPPAPPEKDLLRVEIDGIEGRDDD